MGWIADLLKEIPSAARYKSELEAMERENIALKKKASDLEAEKAILQSQIIDFRQEIQRRDDVIQKEKSHGYLLKTAKTKWGCLVFSGDNKLYCPSCFHKTGKKIETFRIDTRNRWLNRYKVFPFLYLPPIFPPSYPHSQIGAIKIHDNIFILTSNYYSCIIPPRNNQHPPGATMKHTAEGRMKPIIAILAIIFVAATFYGIWNIAKRVNYELQYREMVKQTITEMVKKECLR